MVTKSITYYLLQSISFTPPPPFSSLFLANESTII